MKKFASFILFSSAFNLLTAHAAVDCNALSLSVKFAVKAEKARLLEIVSKEVSAAPSCACEIVKAAIEGSSANSKTVAAIVEAAANAAPDQISVISQCALAVAPDAFADVQAVIAQIDPKNPLDFPGSHLMTMNGGTSSGGGTASGGGTTAGGQSVVGPTPGGPGGLGMFPFSPVPTSGAGGATFVPAPGSVTLAPTGSTGGASGSANQANTPSGPPTDVNFPTD